MNNHLRKARLRVLVERDHVMNHATDVSVSVGVDQVRSLKAGSSRPEECTVHDLDFEILASMDHGAQPGVLLEALYA